MFHIAHSSSCVLSIDPGSAKETWNKK